MRCFVAIELEQAARDRLERFIARHVAPHGALRATPPPQLHITLRFLGDTGEAQLAPLCDVVRSVSSDLGRDRGNAPSYRVGGLGCFPTPHSPRVLWAGIAEDGWMGAWLRRAEAEFVALGFAPETRPFHAHVTLARANSPAGSAVIRQVLAGEPLPESAHTAQAVTLLESRLSRSGATYHVLLRVPLPRS